MTKQQPRSLASIIDTKLIELEHECDSMTHEEVCEQFQGYEWEVLERRTGEAGVFAVVNNNLGDKGMRHFQPYSISKSSRFQTMAVALREESLL